MKMKQLLLLLLFGALLNTNLLAQNTYYVATENDGGNDNNSGTIDAPFATVNKALTVLQAGDICKIRGGKYHEEVLIKNLEGSSSAPITIEAYEGEEVIFDGTIPLEYTWQQVEGNIYKTTISQDIWQLFVGGKERVPARWPNAQFHDNTVYDQHHQAGGKESVNSNGYMMTNPSEGYDLSALNFSMEGAIVIANTGSFKTYALDVLTHQQGNNDFTYTPTGKGVYRGKHHYFFFENKLELLDTENEWFFDEDSKELYMWVNERETIENLEIRGKVQSFAFEFENSNYINLKGIKFFGTTTYIGQSKYITVEDCLFAYPNCTKRMLGETGVPDVTQIKQAMAKDPSYCTLRRCLFEYTDGEALRINGDGNLVENCYFHHIDWSCGSIDGLQVSINGTGINNTFTKNTFHTSGASVAFYPGERSTVTYNDISDIGNLQSDGANIQITKAYVEGSEIAYNWIHDTPKYGMRFDAPAGNASVAGNEGLVHHNVIWNVTGASGMMIKGNNQKIFNNTLFNNNKNDIIMLDEENGNTESFCQNNLAQKISGHRANSYTQNPVPGTYTNNWNGYTDSGDLLSFLTSPSTKDFSPKANAGIVDGGIAIEGITDGYKGSAPDIGAYEVGDTWKAGIDWTPQFYPWDEDTEAPITGEEPLSLRFHKKKRISVYPNPTKGNINLEGVALNTYIEIYDMKGHKLHNWQYTGQTLNLSDLRNGIYLLKVIDSGIVTFNRIMIQK